LLNCPITRNYHVWSGVTPMKNKFRLLFGASMFAFPIAATAGQPVVLSDAQMDRVVAGAVASAAGLADALGNLEAQTLTFTLSSADAIHGTALALGLSSASASSLLVPAAASSKSAAIARAP
jgi:hypothetical protein